jgi:ribosomal protein L20A (L18A)
LFFSLLVSRIRLERLKMRIAEINEIMEDMNIGFSQK